MHGMNDEQDMRRYGALRTYLPVTFATFGLCYLAIIGIPPFAGFYSKDAIIEAALAAGGLRGAMMGAVTVLGAGITAFYMTRVMLMTFYGDKRWSPRAQPHEAPPVMTWPMIVLALGALFSGGLLAVGGTLQRWLDPVVNPSGAHEAGPAVPTWVSTTATLAVVAAGAVVAYAMYARRPVPATAPEDVSVLTVAARRDLYGDAINEEMLMRPGQRMVRGLVETDDRAVEGSVNALAASVRGASQRLRGLQTGFARSYALTMLVGAVLVVGLILAVRL